MNQDVCSRPTWISHLPLAWTAVLLLQTAAARGLDFPVSNLADAGAGSLRQAVLDANSTPGNDTITFDPGLTGVIELASVLPTITESVEILGPGAEQLTVDANQHGRVLLLDGPSSSTFVVAGLTLTGGQLFNTDGAGILLDLKQDLILDGVHLTGNVTTLGSGGGLYAADITNVTIVDSVVSNNSAYAGGGIFALRNLNVETSTIHGNESVLGAAGLAGFQVDLFYSTVADNRAPGGDFTISESGGIHVFDGGQLTMVQATVVGNVADSAPGVLLVNTAQAILVTSSIVAGNRTELGTEIDCSTPLGMVNGHNLSGDASCGFIGGVDFQNTDPELLPLLWAGGPTPTMVPRPGSPVIDAANPFFCESSDQRGFASPVDGDGAGGAACDIGAAEYTPGPDDLLEIHSDGFESGDTSAWSATVP